MRLAEIMSKPVATVRPDVTASAADAEMRRRHIHHLVVASGRDVLGVLSQRDLASAPGDAEVGGLMAQDVIVASPTTTIKDAANRLRGRGVGCLPIVERGRVVGIVTLSDVLRLVGEGDVRPARATQRRVLRARGPRKTRPSPDRSRLAYD
jgi:CBS domain-containing protein